jgi:hypothetical protein
VLCSKNRRQMANINRGGNEKEEDRKAPAKDIMIK